MTGPPSETMADFAEPKHKKEALEMKQFHAVEEAYLELILGCLDFVRGRRWDSVTCHTLIDDRGTRSHLFLTYTDRIDREGGDQVDPSIDRAGAALFLRDGLPNNVCSLIRSLSFTLYPDGRFDVAYDREQAVVQDLADTPVTDDEIRVFFNGLVGKVGAWRGQGGAHFVSKNSCSRV